MSETISVISNEDLTKMARYILRSAPQDVAAWERKRGYSREDMEQEVAMLLTSYLASDKYAQHCERAKANGVEPAKFTTCMIGYAMAAFGRIHRREQIVPVLSIDATVSDGDGGDCMIADVIADRSTTSASLDEVITLLREGDVPMSIEGAWEWWDNAFRVDGGEGLDRELISQLFTLPQEQLAALMLVEVFRIDHTVLAEIVTTENARMIAGLVTQAQHNMGRGLPGRVNVTPPQPHECFGSLCQAVQPDLFGDVQLMDWIDALEEYLDQTRSKRARMEMG
jgi:hypothetical protein